MRAKVRQEDYNEIVELACNILGIEHHDQGVS